MEKKKKGIFMILALFALLIGSGCFFWNKKGTASISIIGGTDGPTSIFLAGKVNNMFISVMMIIGVIILGLFFVRGI